MPRTCTACTHPDREAIDLALAAGKGYRAISRQYSLSKDAVRRHYDEHLPAALVKSEEARQTVQALDVIGQLNTINSATWEILQESRKAKDRKTALQAIDRVTKQIELQAKLLGELKEGATVNVNVQLEQAQQTILQALQPFPAARIAVAAALAGNADRS